MGTAALFGLVLSGCVLPAHPTTHYTLDNGYRVDVGSTVIEASALNSVVATTSTLTDPKGNLVDDDTTVLTGTSVGQGILSTVQLVTLGMTAFGLVCVASSNC